MIIFMPLIQTVSDYLTFFDNIDQYSTEEIIETIKDAPLLYGHLSEPLASNPRVIEAFLYKNPNAWISLPAHIRESDIYKHMLQEYPILLKFVPNHHLISIDELHAYLQVGSVLDLNLYQPTLKVHTTILIPSLLKQMNETDDLTIFLQKVPKILWAANHAELGRAGETLLLNSIGKIDYWPSRLNGFYKGLVTILNKEESNQGVAAWRAFWGKPCQWTYNELLHQNPILQLSLDPEMKPLTSWTLQDIEPFIQQHIKPLDVLCEEYNLYL